MTFSTVNIHEQFKFNGVHYSNDSLLQLAYNLVKEGESYQQHIGNFFIQWLNEDDFIEVNTSGSTGIPKPIKIKKQAMVQSALATGVFFNLKAGNTALHCLPTQFIAGKMMLVRAMVLGLEIDCIEPITKPVFNSHNVYDFCAMIPLQLEQSLDKIENINTIIVGGASVSNSLKTKIQNIKTTIFETYGMTETVTHIALKKINNFPEVANKLQQSFKTLPNISISQDSRHCLVIEAPLLSDKSIITNDIVKLHSETEFEWLGRFDNVINSGGLKLFPEQIEAKLQNHIKSRFFIASKPHDTLGEQLILVLEGDIQSITDSVFSELSKHEKPKHIFTLQQFIETDSGKINRQHTLKLLPLG